MKKSRPFLLVELDQLEMELMDFDRFIRNNKRTERRLLEQRDRLLKEIEEKKLELKEAEMEKEVHYD